MGLGGQKAIAMYMIMWIACGTHKRAKVSPVAGSTETLLQSVIIRSMQYTYDFEWFVGNAILYCVDG